MRLKDKVSIITGAGSGIGRATAIKFAQEGSKVVVAEFNEDTGKETVNIINEAGGHASFKKVNVAEFKEMEELMDYTVETYGRLDVIFNNAGIGLHEPLFDHTPEDYDTVVKINQYGVYYGILAAARKMKELNIEGTIINTASVFAFMASYHIIGYNAAKGAVKMMTQSAALDLAPYGIRVVGVAPGSVDTRIIQSYKDAGKTERLARHQMRGKLMQPEQIANVVAFLASEEASGINGTTIMVDDGFTAFK
ncbi:SDR family oxidoreductase [Priestia megaterium]|nr:SDR family oxidoreductase [Priestia megaterium]